MNGKAITIKNQSLDILTLGNTLAQSGYFSDTRGAAQAIVKVLAGQEIGLGPIASMTGIHIIQGRPALSANAMAAVIKNHPSYDYRVIELSNEVCRLRFFADGEKVGVSEFSIKDAQQAGLTTGKNQHSWRNYPRNMLFARAMSNGAKWFCPDAFSGVPPYTPDEFDVVIDGESGNVIEPQETPSNDLEFEQVLEAENHQDRRSAQAEAVEAFYAQCRIEYNLDDQGINDILAVYKVKEFNPSRTDKYLKAIETQLKEPTCGAALIAVANTQLGQKKYDNFHYLKNAVAKVDPDFVWPRPRENAEQWSIALAHAIEYASAPTGDAPDQAPLFPDEPEPVKYE